MEILAIQVNVQYTDLGLIYLVTLETDQMQMCVKNAGGNVLKQKAKKLKNN